MQPKFSGFAAWAAVIAVASAFGAAAHTPLKESMPAAGASVAAPVKQVVLTFGGDVRLTAVSLVDVAGKAKKIDAAPAALAATFTLAVQDELAAGDYVVAWRAVGADTHIVAGEIHFSVTVAHSH